MIDDLSQLPQLLVVLDQRSLASVVVPDLSIVLSTIS